MTHHTTTIVAVYTDAGTTDATFTHWTARCTCGATAHTRRLLTAEQWATRPHPTPRAVDVTTLGEHGPVWCPAEPLIFPDPTDRSPRL